MPGDPDPFPSYMTSTADPECGGLRCSKQLSTAAVEKCARVRNETEAGYGPGGRVYLGMCGELLGVLKLHHHAYTATARTYAEDVPARTAPIASESAERCRKVAQVCYYS